MGVQCSQPQTQPQQYENKKPSITQPPIIDTSSTKQFEDINIVRNKMQQTINFIINTMNDFCIQDQKCYFDQLVKFNNFLKSKSQTVYPNYIGKLNQYNKPIGMGLYYKKKQKYNNYQQIFLGQLAQNEPKGPGIKIKIFPENKNIGKMSQIQKQQITFIIDWSSQIMSKGCIINNQINITPLVFFGQFDIKNQMKKGHYILTSKMGKQQYIGYFQNNMFHDKNGIIIVPGEYKYAGGFEKNCKSGFGILEDYRKRTVYIGQFKNNEKQGYGEVIYTGDKTTKLRGFWKDGDMIKKLGVFVDQNGQKIKLYDN